MKVKRKMLFDFIDFRLSTTSNLSEMHWEALLRTYGCFFAEFLEKQSPVRRGLLDLGTCVGVAVRFPYALTVEAFLGSWL
jgi:hypothetical protein